MVASWERAASLWRSRLFCTGGSVAGKTAGESPYPRTSLDGFSAFRFPLGPSARWNKLFKLQGLQSRERHRIFTMLLQS